jgi:hypothetical protein
MKTRKHIVVLTLILAIQATLAYAQWVDLHENMMNSTFKIEGEGSLGACFIVFRPSETRPEGGYHVLVTAAHVLEGMKGDTAKVHLRKRTSDTTFERLIHNLQIRNNGVPLWYRNPDSDVAVMYINTPSDAYVSPGSLPVFATDQVLKDYKVGPGYELFALGFPFGAECNDAGFPILRSGSIASYPILPTQETRTFLFDLEVRKGNSGGPVYIADTARIIPSEGANIKWINMIAGLVSQEKAITQEVQSPYRTTREEFPLNVAVVVHGSVIRETIEKLPWPASEIRAVEQGN